MVKRKTVLKVGAIGLAFVLMQAPVLSNRRLIYFPARSFASILLCGAGLIGSPHELNAVESRLAHYGT